MTSFEHRQACAEMDLRHGFGDAVSQQVTAYDNAGASQYVFQMMQKLAYQTGFTAITMKDEFLGQAQRRPGAGRTSASGPPSSRWRRAGGTDGGTPC